MSLGERVAGRIQSWRQLWREHRRVAVLAAGGVLLVLSGAVVSTILLVRTVSLQPERVTLAQALEALDRGAFVLARKLAHELEERGDLPPDQFGGPAFVIGASRLRGADETWGDTQASKALLAARSLQEAHTHGFPPGRQAEGPFLLGKALFASGQTGACRQPLQEALDAGWRGRTAIYEMLAEAFLNDADPDYEQALKYLGDYLADEKLAQDDRVRAELTRCRVLLDLGRVDDCRQRLAELPAEVRRGRDGSTIEGHILLVEARQLARVSGPNQAQADRRQVQAKYREAIQLLRHVQQQNTLDREATRVSMYLIGVCLEEMGETYLGEALGQLARTRKLFFDSPEGFAALVLEADVLRRLKRAKGAVTAYRLALSLVDDPSQYRNPWLPLVQLRTRLLRAYEDFVRAKEFERALELASRFPPVFSRIRALERVAQAAERWGQWLAQDPGHAADRQIGLHGRAARQHFREAGQAYLRLAQLRYATRSYPQDLWRSGQNLLLGQDYRSAVTVLDEYLQTEAKRYRPKALVGLGTAYLALGKTAESVRVLRDCIDFYPGDPATYEARLTCSKAYLERDEVKLGEELLLANISGDDLAPASAEWRDSLFALAQLYYDAGRYGAAAVRLEEAIERYLDTPYSIQSAYLLAETCRERARKPQTRIRASRIPSERLLLRRQVSELLGKASEYYVRARESLIRREEKTELSEHEQAILRNCYFAQGSVLFDLGRYAEAIEVYAQATTRYQNQATVLESYLKIAQCYRHRNEPVLARGAIEQAKVALKRLPTSEPLEATTNYARSEWAGLLGHLSAL